MEARLRARILIVDDCAADLKLASDALEMNGYVVVQAFNAAQAQRILEHTIPNLILADAALPGAGGLALTCELKSDERLKHVPIIALTPFATEADAFRTRNESCDGSIATPVDAQRVAIQVAAFLVRGPARQWRSTAAAP